MLTGRNPYPGAVAILIKGRAAKFIKIVIAPRSELEHQACFQSHRNNLAMMFRSLDIAA